jgi:glycogen debranching enzyme
MVMEQNEFLRPIDDQFHISPDAVNYDDRVNVLNHSNTFGLFDRWGNITSHGNMAQGIYHDGTRYISKLVLTLNDLKPLLLSSTIKEDNDILSVDLSNPELTSCNIPDNTLHLSRNQFVREGGFYEEIACYYYGEENCSFELNLAFEGDFKDIFEIRGIKRELGTNPVTSSSGDGSYVISYLGLDGIDRKSAVKFDSNVPYLVINNIATFTLSLAPKESVKIRYCIHFLTNDQWDLTHDYQTAKESIQAELVQDRMLFADVTTTNEQFNHWIDRSRVDLLSLFAHTRIGRYPYAGVPWFNTPFGRDGIITAIETLWLAPEISRNVLLFLANRQAKEVIPEKDAEPGKILHEARRGEMANTGEIPFKEYYGTIDATPLFIMLAGMYYERTGDLDLIRGIWPNIQSALNWIDVYGDVDGDGFVEYQHKAHNGLTNQGWKDSFDAIMYEDGQLADPPIALAEVQGYVYSAKVHASRMAEALGETELATDLYRQAVTLKVQFNERFWNEELQCFVLALDGNKKQCKVVASNAGQCLFTQIADVNKARKVADRLFMPDMFSGWGIRTLSKETNGFNPMSYHNGSIWPHDNALITYGLSLYGFHDYVHQLIEAIFDAALFIHMQRLPELYCGFDRRAGEGPTAYPVACSPQAWAVAVVFMLLQACIRIEINAASKTIVFNKPRLPEYLELISIRDLDLGGSTCDLEMKKLPNDVGFYLINRPDDWEIIIKK